MSSPRYSILAYDGREVKASWKTNNLAQAEIIVRDYQSKYEKVDLNRLRGIVQGVAVYDILRTYKGVVK